MCVGVYTGGARAFVFNSPFANRVMDFTRRYYLFPPFYNVDKYQFRVINAPDVSGVVVIEHYFFRYRYFSPRR